jgi:signal transduction histidine kinase/tetratricopeptide (TPR) repeat protein
VLVNIHLSRVCFVPQRRHFARIFILASFFVFIPLTNLFCQTNPFKIDDGLYAYYSKCFDNIKSDRVLQMADTLFNMSKKKKDVKAQCLALNLKGEHYYYVWDIDNLLKEKEKIGNFARKTPYTQYVFSIWNRVINYYLSSGSMSKAMDEMRAYQKEALRLNDRYGIGNSYKKISDTYIALDNYDLALEELQKGAEYFKAHNLSVELDNIYASMGNVYLLSGKPELSIKYYNEALSITPVESTKGPYYLALARANLQQNNLIETERYMKLAQEWEKHHKMTVLNNSVKFKLYCEYYIKDGELNKALQYTDSIPELNAYKYKTEIYEKMGDYKNAYLLYCRYAEQEKNKINENSRRSLSEYTAMYDKERVENEKNALALKNSQLALEQLKTKDMLLAAEKAGNLLALSNTKLELKNKNLALKTQKAEVEKQKADASRQRAISANARQHARNIRRFSAILILFFIMLSGAAFAYASQRQRAAVKLKGEVDKVKRAREEADRAREAAEKSQKEAEDANKMKSLFIQNMSHEIRTPLNAIIGFTDLMNDSSSQLDSADKEQFRRLIHDNGNLLTTLINDILDLSKLESGTYDIHIESLSALNVCKNAVASVQSRVKKNVKLIFDPAAGNIAFDSDPQRVLQVLTNLLTNACKCTDNGSITLSYKKIDDNISFSVTDTGCGVPAEDAEKIFERFEKLDKFRQGTGLGLNICRQIATLLKGKIYVDTSYTGGARFIFEQPIHQAS